MNALLEIAFLTFPMTVIMTVAGAMAGGLVFGPIGSIVGAAVGLIGGAALETWLQPRIAAAARAKWARA